MTELGQALLVPEAGSSGLHGAISGMLRARLSRVLASPWGRLPEGRELHAAVVHALKAQPAAVFSALRRPSVHAHFEAAPYADDPVPSLRAGAATLLAELAVANALTAPVVVPVPPTMLLLRSRRLVLRPTGPLSLSNGAIRSGQRDLLEGAELAHVLIDGTGLSDLTLALVDDNPLAMEEAHPDKDGNALSLGGHGAAEWIESLRDATLRTIRYMPTFEPELALGLSQIVPVGYHDQRHLSASYREAVGTIYMTLHPDPMTMTEALVHEFQHNKLNAALDLDPFLENAFDELVVSPVRPDPRPLHGVVLAVHAFLPIAELYVRMQDEDDPIARSPRFSHRFADIVRINHEGLTTVIAHARPTAAGARLIEEMKDFDARHRARLPAA